MKILLLIGKNLPKLKLIFFICLIHLNAHGKKVYVSDIDSLNSLAYQVELHVVEEHKDWFTFYKIFNRYEKSLVVKNRKSQELIEFKNTQKAFFLNNTVWILNKFSELIIYNLTTHEDVKIENIKGIEKINENFAIQYVKNQTVRVVDDNQWEYFNGKIDGMQGKSTNDALVKFKKEHKLPVNEELTDELFKALKKQTVKRAQEELSKLGYKLKADGLTGPTTKKTIETFQKRYSYKVTGEPDLATLHQINARVAANNRRTPAANNTASNVSNNQPVRGVMPTMGAKGAQGERILTSAPQAIVGRMSMIHNSKGVLSGCKVNNISISAAMCGSARNNQQCRIVYRKGRVLSVSCRG